MPLAEDLRPKKIEHIVGQKHLIGEGKLINNLLKNKDKYFPNLIMWGPPGIGKTTLAEVMCNELNLNFIKLNATTAKIADIQSAIEDSNKIENTNGLVLFIDEFHKLNRGNQQILLDYMEKGTINLIAGTTENPYHAIQKGVISRSIVIELRPLEIYDIIDGLLRGVEYLNQSDYLNLETDNDALNYIAMLSNGDMRQALNILELVAYSTLPNKEGISNVTVDTIKTLSFSKHINMDKDGTSHYDLLSAFQKSIRGSDPDASMHYLVRLIKGGDIVSICRRLLVIASEDVGLAYPNAISIVKSCIDAAKEVGLEECKFHLAQATLLLATSPKSNSLYLALKNAEHDLENKCIADVPRHLKDSHYEGASRLGIGVNYLYPHNYPHHYVKQQYLPDNIKDACYYIPQENKTEISIKKHLDFLKKL